MAGQDVNFYKYLEAAFRFKLFNPEGQRADFDAYFSQLNYSLTFKQIFDYARRVLPAFYRDTGRFPDTEEGNLQMARDFIQKLDRHQDPELDKYFNPATAPAENNLIIQEAAKESVAGTAGQQTVENPPSSTAPAPIPPLAAHTNPATVQRIGQGEVVKTMESPREEAFENEPEYKTDPAKKPPAETSKSTTRQTSTPVPKVSSQAGTPVKTAPRSRFRIPGGISEGFRNSTSALGRSFYGNIGSRMSLNNLATGMLSLIGGAGESLGAMGSRPGIPSGGIFGSIRRIFPERNGPGFRTRFNKTSGLSKPSIFSPGKRVLVGALALFGVFFVFSLSFAISQSTSEANPQTSSSINYTIPFRDASIVPLDIKDQVKNDFPGAKLEYWDLIVQKSIDAGFNPALTLALWIEETGASQATLIKNGGSEIITNGALSKGHLGCAPKEDQTIDESLSCLFKFVQTYNFTASQFTQFMETYSSGPPGNPFGNNPSFPNGIKSWYARLVPSGPGAIQPITTSAAATCPIPQGAISTPSYQADPIQGHCGSKYGYSCRCGTEGRRAKAIDVPTGGKAVVLPTIEGQQVTWHLVAGPYPVDNQEGGGVGYTFETLLGSDKWYLDMLHLKLSPISQGVDYLSGKSIGEASAEHVHMTIGKNLSSAPVAGTSTDCDPGWLPSDFMCK